jgi:uncharacterized protein (TIGR02284 family)
MIRPHSLDSKTIARLRQLVVATYSGRDDLYTAAEQVGDDDLSVICRKLADNLAGHAADLEQIILMHNEEPGFEDALTSTLSYEILQFLRKGRGDNGIISVVQKEQSDIQKQYDATIAAARDPAAHEVLEKQKKDVNFAERVLRRVSPLYQNNPSATKPHSDKSGDEPYQIGELP